MSLIAENVEVRAEQKALISEVNAVVNPGEVLVVLGPNGAGKTTLLAALAGDRPVDKGQVKLNGERVHDVPIAQLAERRAVVSAPSSLAFDFTVADVVSMGWVHGARFGSVVTAAALDEVLERCELTALANRVYMTLSSGERQRVQFARGLLQIWRAHDDDTPRWLLLDEPTANLDIAHSISLLTALREEAARGIGVMAIVHDLDLGARFADQVLLLARGHVAAAGPPHEVMNATTLTHIYGTRVHVEYNRQLERLVVLT